MACVLYPIVHIFRKKKERRKMFLVFCFVLFILIFHSAVHLKSVSLLVCFISNLRSTGVDVDLCKRQWMYSLVNIYNMLASRVVIDVRFVCEYTIHRILLYMESQCECLVCFFILLFFLWTFFFLVVLSALMCYALCLDI